MCVCVRARAQASWLGGGQEGWTDQEEEDASKCSHFLPSTRRAPCSQRDLRSPSRAIFSPDPHLPTHPQIRPHPATHRRRGSLVITPPLTPTALR